MRAPPREKIRPRHPNCTPVRKIKPIIAVAGPQNMQSEMVSAPPATIAKLPPARSLTDDRQRAWEAEEIGAAMNLADWETTAPREEMSSG